MDPAVLKHFFINLFIVFLKKTFSDLYFETSFVKFGNLNF